MSYQYSAQAPTGRKRTPLRDLSFREPTQVAGAVIQALRTSRPWEGQTLAPYGPLADLYRELLEEGVPSWCEQHQGHLYLAVNASWPGLVKIGCTRRSVASRMASLSAAGVATPWRALWSLAVHDAYALETQAHRACSAWRVEREFFSVPPAQAQTLIQTVCQADARQLAGGLALWVGEDVLRQCFPLANAPQLH